ncbi:SPRY domain-containing SOCS box protein 3-like [Aphidius gifuensis]|uniref:SPRY domain-containing SOCS box protein 3-like n=1 Tax=Aphidius gifuensis TaxID=684658 RepID=UPI001CDCFF76|nr:SPRY domain-containing SOCS box protein 3-like [Aphidius gifuensis]
MSGLYSHDNTNAPLIVKKYCDCPGKTKCQCGEATRFEWTWDEKVISPTNSLSISKENREVEFHPGYSSGTAAVRANKFMEKNRHHYWEVKMITPIYGTDVMIGVGTEQAELSANNKFCSLLGLNKESWGFSYKGKIQHNGERRDYSEQFYQGSLVGVYYDSWKGTIEFFVNRKSLGIAFTGLYNLTLYPMVCSTAAKSIIRLSQCLSTQSSLQMECLMMLRPTDFTYLKTTFPGLRYLTKSLLTDILRNRQGANQNDDDDNDDYEFPAKYMILDDFDFALVGFGRRKKKPKLCSSP